MQQNNNTSLELFQYQDPATSKPLRFFITENGGVYFLVYDLGKMLNYKDLRIRVHMTDAGRQKVYRNGKRGLTRMEIFELLKSIPQAITEVAKRDVLNAASSIIDAIARNEPLVVAEPPAKEPRASSKVRAEVKDLRAKVKALNDWMVGQEARIKALEAAAMPAVAFSS